MLLNDNDGLEAVLRDQLTVALLLLRRAAIGNLRPCLARLGQCGLGLRLHRVSLARLLWREFE